MRQNLAALRAATDKRRAQAPSVSGKRKLSDRDLNCILAKQYDALPDAYKRKYMVEAAVEVATEEKSAAEEVR
jgi:hypothetical protein